MIGRRPSRAPPALLRTLAGDVRGVGTIEFAVLTPVVCLMLLGASDLALGFNKKMKLEEAAARAVEKATGRGQVGTSYETMRTEAAIAAGEPLANVTLDTWLECDGVRQAAFNGSCASGTQTARYLSIVVTGTYRTTINYGPMAQIFGGNGRSSSVVLTGDSLVRIQ